MNPPIGTPRLRYRPKNCTTDGSPFGGAPQHRPDAAVAHSPTSIRGVAVPHTNGIESFSTPREFTIDAAASVVAAAIPDREMIVQGDRRFTYARIDERARRFASFLHSQGLGCHTERSDLAAHEVGQDLLGVSGLQRKRIHRGTARCVPRARRAVQRQLPLHGQRTRRAARQLGGDGVAVSRGVRPRRSRPYGRACRHCGC